MKILWAKADFLHPVTRGAVIRTLETLRQLHRRHEIHYVALEDKRFPEGMANAREYCTRAYPIPHFVPGKKSPAFAGQLLSGLFSPLPVAVSRYRSTAMRKKLAELLATERFDSLVCDFLFPAPNIPDLSRCVLFQHNVETMIWRRRVEQTSGPAARAYVAMQARRMATYERQACLAAGHIIAVSENDASIMRKEFGATRISCTATGVDTDYFSPPDHSEASADIVFVGSMDWEANIDGAEFFLNDILPLIWRERPETTVALVGRSPDPRIQRMAQTDSRIKVTGTVPDIRPWLWGATVAIVPLRIGGGTRLKIYEAMAAGIPVVSTTIGCEGLPLTANQHLLVSDVAGEFAAKCLLLMQDSGERQRLAGAARHLVESKFSWETSAAQFEEVLRNAPRPC